MHMHAKTGLRHDVNMTLIMTPIIMTRPCRGRTFAGMPRTNTRITNG